jgi:periplasmic protein CpxP/Spy
MITSSHTVATLALAAIVLAQPVTGFGADVKSVAAKTKSQQQPGDVEARITTLHKQLRITPEQEAAWNDVAQAMRDNAKTMGDLRRQQVEKERTASAPDMIHAYGETVDAHANGVHKFAEIFQPLYDSMSEVQKKTADAVFRERVEAARTRQKS